KSLFKFGGVAILGTSFATIIVYIDVIMLGGMRGQADVASFSIGFYIVSIMSVPFVAIGSIVTPLLSTAIRHKKWAEVLNYYKQTSLNNFIIGGFIFILLILSFSDIVNVLPSGKGYENAFYIVCFLGIGRLLDMITGCNSEIIILSKHYMFNFYSIVFVSILKIISNYFLISHFGVEGIAISGLGALFLFNISRYLYIYFKMGFQPFTLKTLIAIFILLITSILTWSILKFIHLDLFGHKFYSALINVIVKSVIWSLIFIPIILLCRVSKELNSFYNLLRSKIQIW
ncbi:MAG: polysaccharide biosynthesis C-terminal domain-containing protein, partial [Saprospiraceae bacterium]